jgi:2-polyprenyl-3-methyl-5-hydroxy-6-metoxy-1,4-benzoquinol methylase
VIVYAACVGDPEKYRTICVPGLRRVVRPEDVVIEARHDRSIFAAYNEVLDAVRDRDDLEALVLLHEDTEVLDGQFGNLIREQVRRPDVAVVGTVGGLGIEGLSWWDGERVGRVAETRGLVDFGGGIHDVDTVDGLVMGLSPWAVRNLRFDEERYAGFDAYDADICAQARAAGKRVVVTELPVVHRHSRVGGDRASSDGGSFERNDAIFKDKWMTAINVADAVRSRGKEENVWYFGNARPEVRALVPASAQRVLDVGCGAGGLGAALKAERGCEVHGLEVFPEAAEQARELLDGALCLDLDTLDEVPAELGTFDAIVFADVLEHLRDPAGVIRTLLPALAEDGAIILSIPNVKHWTVICPLLVHDSWSYEDAGLLDRTHVHFFTAHDVVAMLAGLGFEVTEVQVNDHAPLPPQLEPIVAVADALGAPRAETAARLGAYQYLIVAKRAAEGHAAAPEAERSSAPPPASREELLALVPDTASRVLEVGGENGLEPPPPGAGLFDAIVLRNAVEHVTDPAALVRRLLPSLAEGGVVVCAIPNVKHWSVLLPLLVQDRWAYRDGGTLDRGHVHFFTLDGISDLLDELELEATQLEPRVVAPPRSLRPLIEFAVSAGAEREETTLRLSAYEYLLVARRRTAA